MDTKSRCQSCAMPLGPSYFGTNADGSETSEYCRFCYELGAYTDPLMTVERMISVSVDNMVNDLGMPDEVAKKLANEYIPSLTRWRSAS